MYFDNKDIETVLEVCRREQGNIPASIKELARYQALYNANPNEPAYIYLKQIVGEAIEQLADISDDSPEDQGDYAKLLKGRFLNNKPVHKLVVDDLKISESSFYRKKAPAIAALTRILNGWDSHQDQQLHQEWFARLEPQTYNRIFGIQPYVDQISSLLTESNSSDVILLEGVGGLGKTTLADVSIREMIATNTFDDFGWVSARKSFFAPFNEITAIENPLDNVADLIENLATQLLGQDAMPMPFSIEKVAHILEERLKDMPHLIVLDNLETIRTRPEQQKLIAHLQQFASPSKFLLTSRLHFHGTHRIYNYAVKELDESSSLELIRYKAHQMNIDTILHAHDDELQPIYQHVGGNPLALQLVVGQLEKMSLDVVLTALKESAGTTISAMYQYIYEDIWNSLDPTNQQVLRSFLLVPDEGETFDEIMFTNELARAETIDALELLVMNNLVNYHPGSLHESGLYTIHSLTKTFLENR
ncbi:MAG: NB-ARC domain-containing protein [Chloroflexota bacterium]